MGELKPCPFCGGEAHIAERLTYGGKLYGACCHGTLCPGSEPFPWCLDYEDAAAAWNRRAERRCRNVSDPPSGFYCSACGWGDFCEPSHLLTTACFAGSGGLNYCPNCGARVVEEEK